MGVSGLMRWIRENHAASIEYKSTLSLCFRDRGDGLSILCIDGNVLIHEIAGDLFGYSSPMYNGIVRMKYSRVKEKTEKKLMELIYEEICQLERDSGCNILYFALDGAVPAAKMRTQRERRFMSSREITDFDPLSITYGTRFMRDINEYLQRHMKKKHGNCIRLFSGIDSEGEGEHKIINFLTYSSGMNIQTYIYSIDGDVLILGMLLRYSPIIIRSSYSRPGCYVCVNTEQLRLSISERYGGGEESSDLEVDHIRQTACDFTLIVSLIGNDFLPPCLPAYEGPHAFLEYLMMCYQKHGIICTIGDDSVSVDYASFVQFLHENLEPLETGDIILKHLYPDPEYRAAKDHYNCDLFLDSEYYYNAFVRHRLLSKAPYNGIITQSFSSLSHQKRQLSNEFFRMISWYMKYYTRYMISYSDDINLSEFPITYSFSHPPLMNSLELPSKPMEYSIQTGTNPAVPPVIRERISVILTLPSEKWNLSNQYEFLVNEYDIKTLCDQPVASRHTVVHPSSYSEFFYFASNKG